MSRFCLPVLLGALVIVSAALEGCVATTVAGAAVGVASGAVRTTAKVTGKVAGAAIHVATGGGSRSNHDRQ
ncbi:MAG TPA: hypothetical protein VGL58_06705 [Caulobacteraceae bacterium]|jgi:hypothetical protein